MILNILHLSASQISHLGEAAIEAEVIRRQSYFEEMATQRTGYIVWEGIIDKPAFKGISRGYKRIVKYAKDNNMPMTVLMEDDTKFSHEDSFKYFVSHLPKDFDLYFGVIYQGEIGEDNRVLNGFSGGLSLFIINSPFYDTFLNMNPEDHLDRALGEVAFQHKFYVCKPEVVYQMNGYSFNHRKPMKYDNFLEGKELFTGL